MMKTKDLFPVLLLLFLLILSGCGGGTNTDAGGSTADLVSISATPSGQTLAVGNTRQFRASGIYSDGTSRNLTTQVTWSSSDTSVATVSSSGLATALSTGTTTITTTSGGISGNTTLTVRSGGSGGTINLAWDSNTEAKLAGYKIYYGTATGTYDDSIDVGNVSTFDLTGLTKGQTYFIVVTAYDTSKHESGYSNEVSGMAR